MTEIADGIYRIESDLGPRFICQYVVAGRDRSVLVDTGLADTPAAVIDPYLRRTIARLEALEPELLLTAHYPVLDRAEALEWLATGRVFVDDVERVVREAPAEERDDLWALTQRVGAELGPFSQFVTELGATVREAAH